MIDGNYSRGRCKWFCKESIHLAVASFQKMESYICMETKCPVYFPLFSSCLFMAHTMRCDRKWMGALKTDKEKERIN